MKDFFLPTQNFQRLSELCSELISSPLGIEMAAVIGPPGRGKTTAVERIVVTMPQAAYVYFEERFSPVGLIREIAFAVAGVRPSTTQSCIDAIRDELSRKRKIIIVDEADQMSIKHLNQLRAFHDLHKSPILLVGVADLQRKLVRDPRLKSRVRMTLSFEPVSQADIVVFYRKALDLAVTPSHSAKLLKHAKGDFRYLIVDAARVERFMKASGLREITDDVIDMVVKEDGAE
jgi:DNA transposition AAA+ family ATPase